MKKITLLIYILPLFVYANTINIGFFKYKNNADDLMKKHSDIKLITIKTKNGYAVKIQNLNKQETINISNILEKRNMDYFIIETPVIKTPVFNEEILNKEVLKEIAKNKEINKDINSNDKFNIPEKLFNDKIIKNIKNIKTKNNVPNKNIIKEVKVETKEKLKTEVKNIVPKKIEKQIIEKSINIGFFHNKENANNLINKNKDIELIIVKRKNGFYVRTNVLNENEIIKISNILNERKMDYYFVKTLKTIKSPKKEIQQKKIEKQIIEKPIKKPKKIIKEKIKFLDTIIYHKYDQPIIDINNNQINDIIFDSIENIENNENIEFSILNLEKLLIIKKINPKIKRFLSYNMGKNEFYKNFYHYYKIGLLNKKDYKYFLLGIIKNNKLIIAEKFLNNEFEPISNSFLAKKLFENKETKKSFKIIEKSFKKEKNNEYINYIYKNINFFVNNK